MFLAILINSFMRGTPLVPFLAETPAHDSRQNRSSPSCRARKWPHQDLLAATHSDTVCLKTLTCKVEGIERHLRDRLAEGLGRDAT